MEPSACRFTPTASTSTAPDGVPVVGGRRISPILFVAVALYFRNAFNYIESPANISHYKDFREHEKFESINHQFCNDLIELENLSRAYVGDHYTHLIEELYKKVITHSDIPECSLYPLYQHIRHPIHKLVTQLTHANEVQSKAQ